MIALINCGGSGSRLWPLSTPEYPKHLLSVTNGDGKTLLQNTYERVKDFADEVYFITESGHAHHVKEQLEGVDDDHVIIEPARRGTASCLLIALDHVRERHGDNVPLVFMHADAIINDVDSFRESIAHAARTSVDKSTITLLGVEPNKPSTAFGYIEREKRISDEEEKEVYTVAGFKEKPNYKTAQKYIKEGHYLWNMGFFAAPLKVFVNTMKKDAPVLHKGYESLVNADDKKKAYLALEDVAIDYALIEPAKKLLAVPGNFDWIDVGNYEDLHVVATQDEDGNAVSGNVAIEDVTNSFIRNDTMTDVAVIGLDNVAVVMTDSGLVVTNRSFAQKVGDVSKRMRKKKSK